MLNNQGQDYDSFLETKLIAPVISGFDVADLNPNLFDFQRVIAASKWAVGSSAVN